MDRYDEYGSGGGQLVQCDICERSFNREALSRHRPICMKSTQKKRKTFDSSKQRAEGTEIAQFRRKNGGVAAAKKRPEPGPGAKKNNWRQKHADFINTIRAARGVKVAMERGEPLPPPPPPSYNPDYVQCDYCGRRFNETAAQRHINFCKEQRERLPAKKPDAMAAQKQAARLQYQPPKLKKGGPGYQQQSPFDYNDAGGFGGGSRNSGYSPKITNSTPVRPRGGASFPSADRTNRNMPDHPSSGQVLRTGRTAQTYSEARQLSANQRAGMGSRKYPSNDNIHGSAYNSSQYTGTGFTSNGRGYSGGGSSSGYGMASRNNNNNRYGGGGGVPVGTPKGRGGSGTGVRQAPGAGRFCYDCGAKFPAPQAKFCSECGAKKSINA